VRCGSRGKCTDIPCSQHTRAECQVYVTLSRSLRRVRPMQGVNHATTPLVRDAEPQRRCWKRIAGGLRASGRGVRPFGAAQRGLNVPPDTAGGWSRGEVMREKVRRPVPRAERDVRWHKAR
jgi:hypothetical protein